MKSKLAIILGSAMLFAGCADSKDTEAVVRTFTSDYDLGTQVVSLGQITSTTKKYVDLGGKVTQVDFISAEATTNATTGVCQLPDTKDMTVSMSTVTAVTKDRITGHQKAWIIPGDYGSAYADSDVNVSGTPAYGDLFLTEPNLDIWISTQASNQSQYKLDQYLKALPVDLWILENDEDYSEVVTDITTSGTGVTTSTSVDLTSNTNYFTERNLNTSARFDMGGFIWQTYSLSNIYNNGGTSYGASMLVPDSVEVGSTWIDDNGSLVGAVGVETIAVAGRHIRALHVVERGSTDIDASASGVAGWCVNFHTSEDEKVSGTQTLAGRSAELNDKCASSYGTRQNGTGWVNQRHVWYYKGLPVKRTEVRVDVAVGRYGYAVADDNNTPAGAKSYNGPFINGSAGSCDLYTPGANITGTPAQIARLQPFAEFTVTKSYETWEATEIRGDYTMVKEYRESLKVK